MPENSSQKSAPTKEKISYSMAETHLQAPARVFQNEVQKIEAVIYAMAEKFLEKMDLEEVMEEISMTRTQQRRRRRKTGCSQKSPWSGKPGYSGKDFGASP